MKLYKYFNYLALAIGSLFVLLGAFYFARGDRESARAFFIFGLVAGVFSIVKLVASNRSASRNS